MKKTNYSFMVSWGMNCYNGVRYIDADRLKRTFASGIRVYDGMCKIDDVMHNIENEPTADVVEVVHGEWITRKSIHREEFYVCSVCKTATDDIWRYCPHCGAKMDGERKKNDKE